MCQSEWARAVGRISTAIEAIDTAAYGRRHQLALVTFRQDIRHIINGETNRVLDETGFDSLGHGGR